MEHLKTTHLEVERNLELEFGNGTHLEVERIWNRNLEMERILKWNAFGSGTHLEQTNLKMECIWKWNVFGI